MYKRQQQALEILDKHCPVKKSPLAAFQGRRPISLEDYRTYLTRVTETGSAAHDIVGLARELEDCKADIVRLQAKLETLKPWLGLDISMRTRGTRETAAFIGTFPQEMTREEILLQLAEKLPEVQAVEVEVLCVASQQTCAFLLCLKSDSSQVETALRSMGFAWPPSPGKEPPSQQAEEISVQIKADVYKRQVSGQNCGRLRARFTWPPVTMRVSRGLRFSNLSIVPVHVPQKAGRMEGKSL